MNRQRVGRLAAGVVILLAAVTGGTRSSGAASTFSASAGGEIVRGLVRLVPALLQEDLLDPGAVTAQAALT